MRSYLLTILFFIVAGEVLAQRNCLSFEYQQQEFDAEPGLRNRVNDIENFIQKKLQANSIAGKPHAGVIFKIPVVVHILYNNPEENISDEKVFSQLEVLNECFRRLNEDSIQTPASFKSLAADCGIEFQLAISDPQRRATTGIIRKYTPVTQWKGDDQMKFSSEAGSDAWDPEQYLNIWVCNLGRAAGYSSFPGGPAEKDGIVIGYNVFGKNRKSGYEMGKTAVHETGHWFGLRHIWGDDYCGDDWVSDTPKQANFTSGCPGGIRLSCNNGPNGDMYMNYMDITLDACTNLFTEGQKERMRSYFVAGGPRYKLLSSNGLQPPLISEIPLPEEPPKWMFAQMYPNPATNELTLDLAYDIRWVGTIIQITNANGQHILQQVISSKVVKLNIEKLKPGLYILVAKRKDGSAIKQKFIKM
jgi:hypothetical protein